MADQNCPHPHSVFYPTCNHTIKCTRPTEAIVLPISSQLPEQHEFSLRPVLTSLSTDKLNTCLVKNRACKKQKRLGRIQCTRFSACQFMVFTASPLHINISYTPLNFSILFNKVAENLPTCVSSQAANWLTTVLASSHRQGL